MPIKFRCKFCHQLMGIAHRKAGTEVECPTCKGKLLVPLTSTEPPPGAAPQAPASPPLFERSDFDDYLHAPQPKKEPVLAGAPQADPKTAFFIESAKIDNGAQFDESMFPNANPIRQIDLGPRDM